MNLTTVRDIYKNRENYLDKEVTVGGWVRSVRDSKSFGFIVLHDGTYFETLQTSLSPFGFILQARHVTQPGCMIIIPKPNFCA